MTRDEKIERILDLRGRLMTNDTFGTLVRTAYDDVQPYGIILSRLSNVSDKQLDNKLKTLESDYKLYSKMAMAGVLLNINYTNHPWISIECPFSKSGGSVVDECTVLQDINIKGIRPSSMIDMRMRYRNINAENINWEHIRFDCGKLSGGKFTMGFNISGLYETTKYPVPIVVDISKLSIKLQEPSWVYDTIDNMFGRHARAGGISHSQVYIGYIDPALVVYDSEDKLTEIANVLKGYGDLKRGYIKYASDVATILKAMASVALLKVAKFAERTPGFDMWHDIFKVEPNLSHSYALLDILNVEYFRSAVASRILLKDNTSYMRALNGLYKIATSPVQAKLRQGMVHHYVGDRMAYIMEVDDNSSYMRDLIDIARSVEQIAIPNIGADRLERGNIKAYYFNGAEQQLGAKAIKKLE